MSAARTGKTPTTLYVLDTNVLLHDPNALLNFQEHQVAIPMTVLEELDQLKAGKHSVAAECRQAIRLIDQVLGLRRRRRWSRACRFAAARTRRAAVCRSS